MGWLNKLERKIGKYAIKNLMILITAINGFVALLAYFQSYMDPEHSILSTLALVPALVLKGEVWRLVTFLFIPPTTSPVWLLFTLYFYYMIGSNLEHQWGSFKFNVYYLIGVLSTIAAAFLGGGGSAAFLNFSLLYAFAYLFPNYQILIFFIIPVKMKYMAILYTLGLVLLVAASPVYGIITVLGSLLNFLLFFGKDILLRIATGRKVYYNRRTFEAQIPKDITIHRCAVCGRTEKDDKSLEFRYCVECEGDYEYCMEHLNTHEHVKNGESSVSK